MVLEIWVDSDSVPKNLRLILLRLGLRLNCPTFFVADRSLPDVVSFIKEHTTQLRKNAKEEGQTDPFILKQIKSKIKMVVVESGPNSADDFMVENIGQKALCITHDIPLAARLLEKGAFVIDDRGGTYNKDNIRALLGNRLVNQELRFQGVFAEQQKTMGQDNSKAFGDNLDRVVTAILKNMKEG